MAEVEIQKKEGSNWWIWLLAALVIAGLIWWAVAASTGDREVAEGDNTVAAVVPAETVETPAAVVGGDAAIAPEQAVPNMPLEAIRANPDAHFGKPISGLATVTEVVGDKAFWIEQDGTRLFAVKAPDQANIPVTQGQQVSLTGTVYNPDKMQEQAPEILKLDEATLKMLQGEPAFLHVTNMEPQNDQTARR